MSAARSSPTNAMLTEGGALRIGLVAPPWVTVPPPGYGGTEAVLDALARGLSRAGHDVVLFTVSRRPQPMVRPPEPAPPRPVRARRADIRSVTGPAPSGRVELVR